MALAQDHPDAYAVCYQKAVDRLLERVRDHHRTDVDAASSLNFTQLIVEHEYPHDTRYYRGPNTWLQSQTLQANYNT